jgi:hypothetical protein
LTAAPTVWWAAYLMITDKRGISALLLQRQLGLQRYETTWMMLHKLRRVMINLERGPLRGEATRPGLARRRRIEGKPATEGTESRAGLGGCGETRPRNRARSNGCLPDFKSARALRGCSKLDSACASPSAPVNRFAQRREVGAAFGGPRHWEFPAMADRNLSQREPRSAPVYLDEFGFRHNRRRQPMAAFQTLLGLGTGASRPHIGR